MSTDVKRVLYKVLSTKIAKKFEALSADSDTGGGARDIRIGRYNSVATIQRICRRMFPTDVRQGQKTFWQGRACWIDENGEHETTLNFWQPTDARPTEGRIAKVANHPCFSAEKFAEALSEGEGRVVSLVFQRADGTLWHSFINETSFSLEGWDPRVAKPIQACLDKGVETGAFTVGLIDLEFGESYCSHD